MSKPTSLNDVFEQSSFLHGANAAYIEDLYSRFQQNPGAVTGDWRAFFTGLKERKEDVIAEAKGPSWKRADWPVPVNGEMVSALAGDWQDAAERRIEQNIAASRVAARDLWLR
jgi:2-oxoglutarate dehydrogenase E1 component